MEDFGKEAKLTEFIIEERLKKEGVTQEKINKILKKKKETPYGGFFPLSRSIKFYKMPIQKCKNFFKDLKIIYHRAKWGWSPYDCWDMDSWFLTVIPQMLDFLAENGSGYSEEFWEDRVQHTNGEAKDWSAFLQRIANDFRKADERILDECLDYNFFKMEYKQRKNCLEFYLNKAMENLAHNFYNLWD